MPPTSSRVTPLAVVLAVAVLAAFVMQVRAWAFLCDDAFISFRYAEHLGRYGMPVFNVVDPPERVEGYTNFSWVVLLALGSAVGVEPTGLAPLRRATQPSRCVWGGASESSRQQVPGGSP